MLEFLAWPTVGLILGLIAIYTFKKPLIKKLEGITSANKDGISFERPQQVEVQKTERTTFDNLMSHPISASTLEREKYIQNQISNLNLGTDAEKVTALTRALATTATEIDFIRIANIIFGSQVALLVNISGTEHGINKSLAEQGFQEAALRFTELHADRSIEDWLKYLLVSNLIRIDEDRIDITQFGTDFLKYLVEARLTYNRYG